jgi:hypothetical protein
LPTANAIENSIDSRLIPTPQSENIALSNVYAISSALGSGAAEVKGATVPGARLSRVAERAAQSSSAEKSRIEGRPHPQRRPPVSGIGGALIKDACRSDITNDDERVAARQKLRDLRGGRARSRRRCRRGRCAGET